MLDKYNFKKQNLTKKNLKTKYRRNSLFVQFKDVQNGPQNQSEKLNCSQKLQISMTTRKRRNFEKKQLNFILSAERAS